MSDTIRYYEKNALQYIASTREVDFSAAQERFLGYLPQNGSPVM